MDEKGISDRLRIVGIDCAAQPKNVGIALASLKRGKIHIDLAERCASPTGKAKEDRWDAATARIAGWISDRPALLALDAPLGWPARMGPALAAHKAGEPLQVPDADQMFRRKTDTFIEKTLGKRPLDIGADKIARAAHGALCLLDALRRTTGKDIPLAWTPESIPELKLAAIEVYPAATLKAHELASEKYKGARNERERIRLRGPQSPTPWRNLTTYLTRSSALSPRPISSTTSL